MKPGKVPEVVLKRSVLNQLNSFRIELGMTEPAIGSDTGEVVLGESCILTAAAMRQGTGTWAAAAAVHAAVNNIYASLGIPAGISVVLTVTEDFSESALRSWIAAMSQACAELGILQISGHTAVSAAVSEPIVAVTAVGSRMAGGKVYRDWPGAAVLMTGVAGKEGTGRLIRAYWKDMQKRFPAWFLEDALKFSETLSVRKEAEVLLRLCRSDGVGKIACHDCSEGGVFSALWELGEALNCGMKLDLRKIPLRQETIEICEFLDLNPYQLFSGGSLLIAAECPEQVMDALEEEGIPVSLLGWLNETRDRALYRDGEVRYLEPYRADEVYRAEKKQDREGDI